MATQDKLLSVHFKALMRVLSIGSISFISALLFSTAAHATANISAVTFSEIICNIQSEMNGYSTVISVVCYVLGAFISIRGVLYLAQRFNGQESDGQGNSTLKGIAHLLGGGALLSAPTLVYILQNSLFLSSNGSASLGACAGGGPISLSAGIGLDQVMMNFSRNISRPMFMLLSGLAIAIGIFLIVRALLAASKYGVDPRASSVKNIVLNFIMGAILVSIANILPVTLMSMFGSSSVDNINSFAGVNWSGLGLAATSTVAVDNALKAGLAFIQIVGGIAFLRGWLMVKNAIEGTSQQTVPQGLTHIIGGAMAINIGTMLKIIDTTFGTGLVY